MIEQIEKALGLRVDWRAHEHLRKQYSWLLDLENRVDDLENENSDLESRIEELEILLYENGIEYD